MYDYSDGRLLQILGFMYLLGCHEKIAVWDFSSSYHLGWIFYLTMVKQGEDKEQESCSYTPVELYAEKSLVRIVVSSTRGQLAGFHSLGKKS